MFRGSVKSTGYPLHPPVSPSLPVPCVTVCHHIATGLLTIVNVFAASSATAAVCDFRIASECTWTVTKPTQEC